MLLAGRRGTHLKALVQVCPKHSREEAAMRAKGESYNFGCFIVGRARKRGGRNAALLLGKDWGLPWLDFVLGKHKKQTHIGVVLCGILL